MAFAQYPAPSAGGGTSPTLATFTATSSWTAPAGVTTAYVVAVGGGGGGSGVYRTAETLASAPGGGGGAYIETWIPVTAGTTYTITIGAGGTGTTTLGGDGGNSTFGSLVTAYGGAGGLASFYEDTSITRSNTNTAVVGSMGGIRCLFSTTNHATQTIYASGGGSNVGISDGDVYPDPTYWGLFDYINTFDGKSMGKAGAMGGPHKMQSNGYGGKNGRGGGGGGGACIRTFTTQSAVANLGANGGAAGGQSFNTTENTVNGNNASANTGGGGGGGTFMRVTTNAVPASGGNGGSGYVEVLYWA